MFNIFCIKYLFIGIFHIFNIASKMAATGHVTIFIIFDSNKSFIYSQHPVTFSQQ